MDPSAHGLALPDLGVENQPGLAALVVEAMCGAHENLAAAQLRSQQSGEGVYAQVWRSLCRDLAKTLSSARYDLQLLKPGHASYRIPVVGDVLLFPWRPAGGHRATEVSFSNSATRSGLWSHPTLPGMLDIAGATTDNDDPVDADGIPPEVFEEARQRHLRVVIIAMTADSQRLRSIEWGEAALESDGHLKWISHEFLFSEKSTSRPADTSPESFNEGAPPPSRVRLREDKTRSDANG